MGDPLVVGALDAKLPAIRAVPFGEISVAGRLPVVNPLLLDIDGADDLFEVVCDEPAVVAAGDFADGSDTG